MNIISKISFLFTVLAAIIGCDDKSNLSQETCDIKIQTKDIVKEICINDIADSLMVVKLETNSESEFSRINRLTIHSDRIFILSKPENSILLFDLSGKFICKIHNLGNGPGEYTSLSDFTIDTDKDELILAANIPNKYLFYTIDGVFLKEIKKTDYFGSLHYNNGYFYHIKHILKKQDYRVVIKNNLNKPIHKTHIPVNQDSWFAAGDGTSIITKSQHLEFSSSFHDNNIYAFNKESIIPKYQVDFLKKELPHDYLAISQKSQENMKILQNLAKSNYFYNISGIREYENFLLFKFEPRYKCLYNKIDSSVQVSYRFYDINHNIPLIDYFAHDGDDNLMLFIQNPNLMNSVYERLINTSDQNEFEKNLVITLGQTTPFDNPILFFYRVKQNINKGGY